MSESVHVAYGDDQAATARSLLDAAEALDLDASVVKISTEHGTFEVPSEVASKAKGVKAHDPNEAATEAVAQAVKDREDAEAAADPGLSLLQRTVSVPDLDAAKAAVGGIDPGPDAAVAGENFDGSSNDPNAKRPVAKRAAKKTAKKTAKKAAAKKES